MTILNDTLRVGPETRAILEELRRHNPIGQYMEIYGSGEWDIQRYGLANYEVFPNVNHHYRILADGKSHRLHIPFGHKWLMILYTQRDAADALTYSNVDFDIAIPYWGHSNMLSGLPARWSYKPSAKATIIFPDQWEFPAATFDLTFTSATVTNNIYPVILIRRL